MKKIKLDPSKILLEFAYSNGEKVEISPAELLEIGTPIREINGREEEGELTGATYHE